MTTTTQPLTPSQLRERATKILAADYFGALGLQRLSSTDDARRAFVELAKTWHPDRLPKDQEELRPLVSKVFARLELARGVLTDAARRAQYLQELEKAVTLNEERALKEADLEYRKAEVHLKKQDQTQAEAHLRRAVLLAPKSTLYQASLIGVLAKPSATKAELMRLASELDRAIAADENCAKAFMIRAQIRKRLDLGERACADFEKVVELEPDNIDAAREVRIFKMRKAAEPPKSESPETKKKEESSGGFFSKLFKR